MAPRPGSQPRSWASTWSTASIRSGSKGRRRSCSACSRACAGKCPTGSSCPAATSATAARSARRFIELQELGLIDRMPRLAVINAAGANTLYELYERRGLRWNGGRPDMAIVDDYYAELDRRDRKADTIASAIEINRPVNLTKCLRALEVLRRRRPRSDRPGNARRQGPGRRRRPRLRAGQRRQRRRREAAARARRHRRRATAWSASSPATSSRTRPRPSPITRTDQDEFNKVLGSRGVQPGRVRQPGGAGGERSRRDREGDSAE